MERRWGHVFVLTALVFVAFSSIASALKPEGRQDGGIRRRRKLDMAAGADNTERLAKHERSGTAEKNDTAILMNYSSPPTLLNSNLGGIGPNETANFMSLAFADVARIEKGDTPVSMILYNTTFYDPRASIEINGITDIWYPTVSVYAGTNVTLRGVFVNNATGKKTKLSSFVLSVINLDTWADGSGEQQVIAKNFEKYKMADGSTVKAEKMADGSTSFMATYQSVVHETPSSPLLFEPDILAGSIALFYKNVEEIELTLQVKNLGNLTSDAVSLSHSRRFFFATVPTQIATGSNAFVDTAAEAESGFDDSSGGGGWQIFLLIPLLLFCLCICCTLGCLAFDMRFGSAFKIGFGSAQPPNGQHEGHPHHGHL